MRLLALTALSAALTGGVAISTLHAEAVKVTPNLTVFSAEPAESVRDGGPTVLRGSANRRGTVDGRPGNGSASAAFQLDAGAKLWLTDPISGDVIVCDERGGDGYGGSFVGCVEDRLSY